MSYCPSIFQTQRWKTKAVMVGPIGVGGNNPIRIQSMTTSNTRDVEATVLQIKQLADHGCEIARVTVQGMKEAEACEAIKNQLLSQGYTIPIVADIHFYPPAAMRVIEFVDKVRINPGNFVDKRASFKLLEYNDETYAKEIEKIEEKFTPLVDKCKKLKKAMRIGTNHGSLSDRIMNRYGDTPQGMVESALEFARIARNNDFHDLIFSMKSSNPQVMIFAYRLLVSEMIRLGWNYPLHLGVTEAGEGEDGRIKSAMGIGTLLLDGLGDTIRVSLTEDAIKEIDPCKRLVSLAQNYQGKGIEPFKEKYRCFDKISARPVVFPKNVSMHRNGTVVLKADLKELTKAQIYESLGYGIENQAPRLKISSVDCLILEKGFLQSEQQEALEELKKLGMTIFASDQNEIANGKLLNLDQAIQQYRLAQSKLKLAKDSAPLALILDEHSKEWDLIEKIAPSLIILSPIDNRLHYSRLFFNWLQEKGLEIPVILGFGYNLSKEDLVIHAAAEIGALLCDKIGEGIWIDSAHETDFLRQLSFNILQAARMRTSKTEFISCPSCGRTLFDLQDVSKRIRQRTAHLPGVKIAIMGCIVNGPGEMADADFGYVGSKPGMIDLYVGKQCVEKEISFAQADDRLIELIKKHNRWVEPEPSINS